jgi:hypothetical protein
VKEQDVAYISEQFGISKEIVESSVNDGTLSQRIKDSLVDKVIYNKEEFETFKTNLTTEASDNYFRSLVEKANKGDIPNELHKPIKGAALQQLERDLSKDYEITDYSNVKDLISKAIQKQSANGKPNAELEKQVDELKTVNLRLAQEKEDALKTVEQKYKSQNIERDKLDALRQTPYDYSEVKPEELEKVKLRTQNLLKSVFDSEYMLDYDDKNRLVVKDKEGNIKKNSATLDPVPVKDVLVELAVEYNLKLQSPDQGGQGGKSSHQTTGVFSNEDEYMKWCAAEKISPTSPRALEMRRTSGLINS